MEAADGSVFANASVAVALAFAAGVSAQALAARLRLPGLVLLLASGVALGPDGLDVVRPASLGGDLMTLVGFAVAVVLFEGGLSLDLRRLLREGRAIQQLVTIGAAVTAFSGALVARLFLGWPWYLCALFGSLIIVTGPTVISPLLRRLRLRASIATVLAAEGVLIDAIGAIVATVVLEFVLHGSSRTPEGAIGTVVLDIGRRLGFGTLAGLLTGVALSLMLRSRRLIPRRLENSVTLGIVLLLYQLCNAFIQESGLAAVTVAGIVVGNAPRASSRELAEFKEQLTFMLIGMLFVLLAADVRLEQVRALGWGGAAAVAAVIVLVRPLNIWVSTARTALGAREKLFLSLIGPRGIVAAAVASLFAIKLSREGLAGGTELRAMVFLVIAATVVWAGLVGSLAARWLKLSSRRDDGWVLLGTSGVARAVAALLEDEGKAVVCVEGDPLGCREAEALGMKVIYGDPLKPLTLQRAAIHGRRGVLALTTSDERNLLFVAQARREAPEIEAYVALGELESGVTPLLVDDAEAGVAFGCAIDIHAWSSRLQEGLARVRWFVLSRPHERSDIRDDAGGRLAAYVPLVLKRGRRRQPVTHNVRFESGDEVALLIDLTKEAAVAQQLRSAGWSPVASAPERPSAGPQQHPSEGSAQVARPHPSFATRRE